jgi:hypothetical protein
MCNVGGILGQIFNNKIYTARNILAREGVFMKKFIVTTMSLVVVLSLSVIAFAQINNTSREEYLTEPVEENYVYENEDAFSHMGIYMDFGDPIPVTPHTLDLDIEAYSEYIVDGWGIGTGAVLRMPGIRRLSPEVEIKITEADLEVIFEFAYQIISEGRPLGHDEYFIRALREADLYDKFVSTIKTMALNQLSESERAYLLEQRELRNQRVQLEQYKNENDLHENTITDLHEVSYGIDISPFNIFVNLSGTTIAPARNVHDTNPSNRLLVGDLVHYSFVLNNTANGVRTGMYERRPITTQFWEWQTYFGPSVNRSSVNAAHVFVSAMNLSFAIGNNHPTTSKRISSGSYTIRW